ncbi:MAG: hypothetical protein A2Z70_04260 [Chloroflexi bacterium RBG_13_48_17]|nr:MAG: hypothetical protein A2Z70_04260 [Chloroflexi bacterium RBG_13_48_17]
MSLVGAQSADQLSDRVATEAMVNLGRCIKQHVPNVVLNARCLLSLRMTVLFIVAPVTRK